MWHSHVHTKDNMTTQVERIRAHLVAGKSITPVAALAVYGISRLSSVIEDLRNSGMQIDCIRKYDEMGKQYGEYRIRKPIKAGSLVQVQHGYGIGLPTWVRKNREATVLAVLDDTAYVRFVRGKNLECHWLNLKELINAD
jgi:hypothetical protein